jgi:hypothetical protein
VFVFPWSAALVVAFSPFPAVVSPGVMVDAFSRSRDGSGELVVEVSVVVDGICNVSSIMVDLGLWSAQTKVSHVGDENELITWET